MFTLACAKNRRLSLYHLCRAALTLSRSGAIWPCAVCLRVYRCYPPVPMCPVRSHTSCMPISATDRIRAVMTSLIVRVARGGVGDNHHHHLPYSTGHFFSVLRTGLYASSPEPHECHGNGNGQANI